MWQLSTIEECLRRQNRSQGTARHHQAFDPGCGTPAQGEADDGNCRERVEKGIFRKGRETMMTTADKEKATLPHYMDVRIVAVIKQAVLAEREACAKIADRLARPSQIASAIRARNASQG